MLAAAGSSDYKQITTTKRGLAALTRWLLRLGLFAQFKLAKEFEEEDEAEEAAAAEAVVDTDENSDVESSRTWMEQPLDAATADRNYGLERGGQGATGGH
jgi:hypothetical protein